MRRQDEETRKRLLALREELINAVNQDDDASAVVELDQSRVGRLSRLDSMQAQAMAKASAVRRDVRLAQVSAALERLDGGEYGLCRHCNRPINPKRLEADPVATLCIECASRQER